MLVFCGDCLPGSTDLAVLAQPHRRDITEWDVVDIAPQRGGTSVSSGRRPATPNCRTDGAHSRVGRRAGCAT